MAPVLALPVAVTMVVIATAGALAQSPWPSPTQPQTAPAWPSSPVPQTSAPVSPQASPAWPSPPSASRPAFDPPQQRGRNCMAEFLPLRQETEKRAAAIKAAAPRKSQPEMCSVFKNLAVAQAKMIKFVDDHGAECRVPAEASKAMKVEQAKIVEIRNKICSAGAAAAPPPPSLSDALGTSRLPDPSAQTRRGGGTFDTLTGSSLGR